MTSSKENAREILGEADKRIRREFAEQPELQEELLTVIEEVYNKIDLVAPAAMILEARGSVQLHAIRGLKQPAVPQLLLFPGDRLQLGADADVHLIVLSDLHKERLKPAGAVTVRRKGCEPPEAVRERGVGEGGAVLPGQGGDAGLKRTDVLFSRTHVRHLRRLRHR